MLNGVTMIGAFLERLSNEDITEMQTKWVFFLIYRLDTLNYTAYK